MNSNRIVQKDYHSHQIGETFFVALTGNAVVRVCPTVRITTVAAWSSSVWYGFRAIEISGTHDGIRFEFSCFNYRVAKADGEENKDKQKYLSAVQETQSYKSCRYYHATLIEVLPSLR